MSQDSAHLLIAPMISAIEKYNWSWVDGIAHDTGQLIALFFHPGSTIELDEQETSGEFDEQLDTSICALLVRKNGGAGFINISDPGPKSKPGSITKSIRYRMEEAPEGQSSALVLIKPGQKCDISDELSLRYFRLIDNTSRDDRIALPAKGDSRLARFGNNLAAAARRSILTLHIGKKNSTAIKDTSGSPVAGSAGLALATRDGE